MDRRRAIGGIAAALAGAAVAPASAVTWSLGFDATLRLLDRAWEHGLDPGPYRRLAAGRERPGEALLSFLRDVAVGRVEPAAAGCRVGRRRFNARAVATALAAGHDPYAILQAVQPPDTDYAELVAVRRRYEAIRRGGGWPTGRPGGRWSVAALRERLAIEGDLVADAGPDSVSGSVVEGLRRFQARHGLLPDGIIGRGTRTILSLDVEDAIAAIDRELERRRWNWPSHPRRVEVNVPDFRLAYLERGRTVLQSRVIVGTVEAPTPIFTTEISAVNLHPSWNVPPGLVRDVLAKGEDWLRRNGFHRDAGRLVQRPGPNNALGLVKFHTGNALNIYLHDSPHRKLFERPSRVFSAGCIRVDRFRDLALALVESEGWGPGRLDAALAGKRSQWIRLERPVVVRIDYRTAWVEDGALHRRADVYGHDAKLAALLGQDRSNDLPWSTDPSGPPLAARQALPQSDLDDTTLIWGG